MTDFLAGVRRRIRLAWAVATGQASAIAIAVVALALVAIGWLWPVTWVEPAALAVVAIAAVGMVAGAMGLRVPEPIAARVADRGLATRDTFSTALEVGERHDPLAESIRDRADSLARAASAADAVPIPWRPLLLIAAGLIAAIALVLALIDSPQDEARRQQAREQAALADEAAALLGAADELRTPGASADQLALANELDALATDLVSASDLNSGLSSLETARAGLAASLSSDLLSQKAAARGLDRSLESTPLPGTSGGNAAAQLASAAAVLNGLSAAERRALQERLEDLADTQAQGNQSAAGALNDAASALANGDLSGAAAALGEAAAAQSSSQQSIDDQQSRADAASALSQSTQRLQDSDSQGGEPGEQGNQNSGGSQDGATGPNGSANGNQNSGGSQDGATGPNGSANGNQNSGGSQDGATGPNGSANGNQNSGGSQDGATGGGSQGGGGSPAGGGGNPTGQVGATGPNASGSNNQDNGGSQNSASRDEQPSVFAPEDAFGAGPQLAAGGSGEEGDAETIGQVDGASGTGNALVPLSDALPRYQEQATAALESADIAPSQRAVVRDYFDNLSQR